MLGLFSRASSRKKVESEEQFFTTSLELLVGQAWSKLGCRTFGGRQRYVPVPRPQPCLGTRGGCVPRTSARSNKPPETNQESNAVLSRISSSNSPEPSSSTLQHPARKMEGLLFNVNNGYGELCQDALLSSLTSLPSPPAATSRASSAATAMDCSPAPTTPT